MRLLGAAYLVILGIRALRHRHEPVAQLQRLNPAAGNLPLQFLLLGASAVLLGLAVDSSVGALAGRLQRVLDGPCGRRRLNVATGSIYLGLGARVALDR